MDKLAQKMRSLEEIFSWAAGCDVLIDSEVERREREENQVEGEISLVRILDVADEIEHVDLELETGLVLENPRQEIQHFYKEFRLEVKFRARTGRISETAWSSALRFKNRIQNAHGRAKLLQNDWSLLETGDILPLPGGVIWDDRVEEQAIVELGLLTSCSDRDTANIGSWWEHFRVTVRLKKPDNTYLPNIELEV